MKKYLVIALIIIGTLAVTFSFRTANKSVENTYQTEHVVILVLDGPRWSETFGDTTYQYIPNLQHQLVPQGVFFSDFANDGQCYTNAGHTAITTGVYQRVENTGKEVPKNPSIFQYYLKQTKAEKSKAWIMTSKGKLNILGHTKDRKWLRMYYPSVYSGVNGSGTGYPADIKMYPIFKSILLHDKPGISLINLLDIDAWAHQGRWDLYIESIVQNDKLALDLWNTIQSDSVMKNKTTLFITNDHGRHLDGVKDGYISHGDNCEGCRHISLIGLGPDFKGGTVIDNHYDLIDINATAAELLHIDVPSSEGEVIWEMFSPDRLKK